MHNELALKKPKVLKKINVSSYKDLFKALAGVAINGATLQWKDATMSAMDAASVLGIATTEEELAWKLVNRAMGQALYTLVDQNQAVFAAAKVDKDDFAKACCFHIDGELTIDHDFFTKPAKSPIVRNFQEILRKWLIYGQVMEAKIAPLVERLPSYFVYALNDEWRKDEGTYKPLLNYFETPFERATRREQDWERYAAWLQMQIHESVFEESFSLAQIYVPLLGYYELKDEEVKGSSDLKGEKPKRVVICLEDHLQNWLSNNDKSDAIRIISGGPGSGKSSFAKMLSAKLAETRKVLFIPLHLLDLKKDLSESIGNYLKLGEFFNENPFDDEAGLVVIFDGLDELTQQGKACAEIAKQFIDDILRFVSLRNQTKSKVNVVITGREVAVQSNGVIFKKEKQIIHVLPYYTTENARELFVDKQCLLDKDKRHDWWKKYGSLGGSGYQNLPEELRIESMIELTSQPLLNYLIALSFDRKQIVFSKDTNLNEVYRDLISSVYGRKYADGTHKALNNLTEENFLQVLEEIAVSAWHGSGRTTTIKEIEEHCKLSDIPVCIDQFKETAKAGVTNLLTAFYFRQAGTQNNGEQTFEFTHKSFSEYLLATRIVRQLKMSYESMELKKSRGFLGWSEVDCLQRWALLCGETPLDQYSFKFLCDEMLLQDINDVSNWQKMLCGLIGYMLRHGMPYEKINPRPSFREETRMSRNAEEALLAALSACSRVTGELSHIEWETMLSAGTWFKKLMGQRPGPGTLFTKCLNNFDMGSSTLDLSDFYGANLQYSSFHRSSLFHTNFMYSDLDHANLKYTFSYNSYFDESSLYNVDLTNAVLTNSNLVNASLID